MLALTLSADRCALFSINVLYLHYLYTYRAFALQFLH